MANRSAYFNYLTKRLDSGESKNVVISTTVGAIGKQLENKKELRVLDVGCFSGAMLNRIYLELPDKLKGRVNLIGLDSDRKAMQYGASKYGTITYIEANLEHKIPLVKQFDVIILCNVLHELFSGDKLGVRKAKIRNVYKRISSLLNSEGELILLDGIKPDDANEEVEIELVSKEWINKLDKLTKEYTAAKLWVKKVSDKIVKINKFTLSVFLAKARYLETDYWKDEAAQLYQYFTARDFEDMVKNAGMQLKKIEAQAIGHDKACEMIKEASLGTELPAKNVLIITVNN